MMRHKIITVDIGTHQGKRNPQLPYIGATISLYESIGRIKELLAKYGCSRILDASESGKDYPLHTIAFEKDGFQYMIDFPVIFTKNSQGKKLNMDISGRLVFYKIKALLADAQIDKMAFMEAMLPYLVLPTPQGPRPLLEYIENNSDAIKAGTAGLLCLPGEDRV